MHISVVFHGAALLPVSNMNTATAIRFSLYACCTPNERHTYTTLFSLSLLLHTLCCRYSCCCCYSRLESNLDTSFASTTVIYTLIYSPLIATAVNVGFNTVWLAAHRSASCEQFFGDVYNEFKAKVYIVCFDSLQSISCGRWQGQGINWLNQHVCARQRKSGER